VLDKIKWFGHASFMIVDENGRKMLFIDPFQLKNVKDKADLVLITHAHYDHWSLSDLKKILKAETEVVAPQGCNPADLRHDNFSFIEPFEQRSIGDVKVKTIPAYNVKPERKSYHPRSNNWVGYVITINDKNIYHAGDTDFVPEMKTLKGINVAMLPIGGTFTMDVDEAIQAANTIKADTTIPMHYRGILKEKSKYAEEKFIKGVKGKVEILEELS